MRSCSVFICFHQCLKSPSLSTLAVFLSLPPRPEHPSGFVESQRQRGANVVERRSSSCLCSSASSSLAVWHSSPTDPALCFWRVVTRADRTAKVQLSKGPKVLDFDDFGIFNLCHSALAVLNLLVSIGFTSTARGSSAPSPILWTKSELPCARMGATKCARCNMMQRLKDSKLHDRLNVK